MNTAGDYNFYIYFFGLICHMGYGPRKHYAAIVRDKEHDPVVRFDDGSQYGKSFPIDAESLKFEIGGTITEADALATPDFLHYVPSLQALMGGSPRINIKEYAIPVYYPETEGASPALDVIRLYDDQAVYYRFGNELRPVECVARLTGIVVKVLNNNYKLRVVQIKPDGKPEYLGDPVDPGSCIVVANLPKTTTMGHVMRYGKILIGNESMVSVLRPYACGVKWKKDANCPWVRNWLDDGPASADVECGNTGWP